MPRLPGSPFLAFTLGLALAGCSHRAGQTCCDSDELPGPQLALPAVDRGKLDLEARIPDRLLYHGDLGRPPAQPGPYRGLSVHECQCAAAAASALANMLDTKAQTVIEQAKSRGRLRQRARRLAEVQQQILHFSALEARNDAAASALEDYFRLEEAEAQHDLLRENFAVLDSAVAQTESLSKQGFRPPVELELLRRQQLDAQSQGEKLQLQTDRLNTDLRRRLGLSPDPVDWRIWPAGDFQVNEEPADVEAAVAVGLSHRPAAQLVRLLIQEVDGDTLPAVQQFLGMTNALLGPSGPPPLCPKLALLMAALHEACGNNPDVESVRRQLRQSLADVEREIASEIRQAALTAQAQRRLAVLARERVRSWQKKVREMADRKAGGTASYAEIASAQLEHLKARNTLASEVIAWRLAMVKLEQAQGLLAAQCGYGADGCHTCPHPPAGPLTDGGKAPCSSLP